MLQSLGSRPAFDAQGTAIHRELGIAGDGLGICDAPRQCHAALEGAVWAVSRRGLERQWCGCLCSGSQGVRLLLGIRNAVLGMMLEALYCVDFSEM